jgi:hypothetical protein
MSPSSLFETKAAPGVEAPPKPARQLPPWLVEPEIHEPEIFEPSEHEAEPEESAASFHPEPIRVAIGFLTIVVLGVAAYSFLFTAPI